LSQHHLLEKIFFTILHGIGSLIKNHYIIKKEEEQREGKETGKRRRWRRKSKIYYIAPLFQNCFGYSVSLEFPYEFWNHQFL
jgi:hypothetical protein